MAFSPRIGASTPVPEARTQRGLGAQVASGLRWGMVDVGLQQVMRFAITVVLTRLVHPRDFGLLGMALVFTQLASLIGDLGLGPALVQRTTITRAHITTAFTVTACAGVVLTILLAALAGPIAAFYDEPRLRAILGVLGVSYALRGISGTPRDLLRRAMRFGDFALTSVVAVGTGGVIGIGLALNGAGVWALVASVIIEGFVGAIMAVVLAARAGVWSFGVAFDRRALGELGSFGAFVSGSRIAYYGASNVDNLIVGKVLGALALGYYNLAYRLMLFPILKVADVVANVTMPALSTIQQDLPRVTEVFRKAVTNVTLVCFPVSVGTCIVAPSVVPLIFGSRWVPAVAVVQILALNGVRLAISRLNAVVYEATGRPHIDLVMLMLTFAAYIVAFVIGVHWGITGVAWGYTIAGHALFPVDQLLVSRALKVKWLSVTSWLVPIAAANCVLAITGVALMTLLADANGAARSAGVIIACGAMYFGALRIFLPGVVGGLVSTIGRR